MVERIVFTTAPEAYDYGTATTVETFPCPWGTSSVFRKVRITETGATEKRVTFLAEYQMGRYASGNNYASGNDPRDAARAR